MCMCGHTSGGECTTSWRVVGGTRGKVGEGGMRLVSTLKRTVDNQNGQDLQVPLLWYDAQEKTQTEESEVKITKTC